MGVEQERNDHLGPELAASLREALTGSRPRRPLPARDGSSGTLASRSFHQ